MRNALYMLLKYGTWANANMQPAATFTGQSSFFVTLFPFNEPDHQKNKTERSRAYGLSGKIYVLKARNLTFKLESTYIFLYRFHSIPILDIPYFIYVYKYAYQLISIYRWICVRRNIK